MGKLHGQKGRVLAVNELELFQRDELLVETIRRFPLMEQQGFFQIICIINFRAWKIQ